MIKLGFIGVNGYARSHLEGFAALQAAGGVKLTALADVSAAAAEEVKRRLPALAKARVYATGETLLARADIDAAVICVPIPLHEEITLTALRRGLFVLLEKPAVPLWSQLERLIAADERLRVMVGFQHIYSDAVRQAKKTVTAGKIGKLTAVRSYGAWPRGDWYYGRADWAGRLVCRGRAVLDGPCTNAFAHFIHNLMFLAGGGPGDCATPLTARGELYRAREIESYDTGAVAGRLAGGAEFFAAFTHATETAAVVITEIVGRRGTLRVTGDGTALIDERGRIHSFADSRRALHEHFLRFAAGAAAANLTPLTAMRGYTLATNLMFQSAGGIRKIGAPYVRAATTAEHGTYPVIGNITEILSVAAQTHCPLHDAGADWATEEPAVLAAADFSEKKMLRRLKSEKLKEKI